MSDYINHRSLEEFRKTKWRLKPSLKIKSESQAVKFIEGVGFCMLFGCKNIPLPKMSQSAQSDDWDWWAWKDTLQAKKKWYNSRAIGKKATLLSMELLPAFLALYYESGGCEVYEEEYYYGKLTSPAYRIADYLYTHGPTSVDTLRKTLATPGKVGTRKFHNAVNELQLKFKLAVADIEDKHWGVRVLDLFSHWVPKEILVKAESMEPRIARQIILQKFLSTSGAASAKEMTRLFGWAPESIHSTLDVLVKTNTIHPTRFHNLDTIYYTVL